MLHIQSDDCEIAKPKYLSNARVPIVIFKRGTVRFNSVCLKMFPNIDNIMFSIHRGDKTLFVEPCAPDELDSIRWSCWNPEKRKPKNTTCSEFYDRLMRFMRWDNNSVYKMIGEFINKSDIEIIIAFNLYSAIIYKPDENGVISRSPAYSHELGDGFGRIVEQHKNNPLFRRFSEDIEINITNEQPSEETEDENEQQL